MMKNRDAMTHLASITSNFSLPEGGGGVNNRLVEGWTAQVPSLTLSAPAHPIHAILFPFDPGQMDFCPRSDGRLTKVKTSFGHVPIRRRKSCGRFLRYPFSKTRHSSIICAKSVNVRTTGAGE